MRKIQNVESTFNAIIGGNNSHALEKGILTPSNIRKAFEAGLKRTLPVYENVTSSFFRYTGKNAKLNRDFSSYSQAQREDYNPFPQKYCFFHCTGQKSHHDLMNLTSA